jgi:hypothetical protein
MYASAMLCCVVVMPCLLQGKHFEHTSLLATLRRLFTTLPRQPLTKVCQMCSHCAADAFDVQREAWAADFLDLMTAPACGSKCPGLIASKTASTVRDDGSETTMRAAEAHDAEMTMRARHMPRECVSGGDQRRRSLHTCMHALVNDLQHDMINAMHGLAAEHDKANARSEVRRCELAVDETMLS